MSNQIETLIKNFAEQHGFDVNTASQCIEGVASRIKHAMNNGAEFTTELVTDALIHWNASQQQKLQLLLDSQGVKGGPFDQLMNKVYDDLASDPELQKEQKLKLKCVHYVKNNYDEWPSNEALGHHASACHYGFSWEQKGSNTPWFLKHENGRVINKSDCFEESDANA